MVIPAFSRHWIDRVEGFGAVPVTDAFRQRIAEVDGADRRKHAWMITREVEERARDAGCAGIVLMGLKYETIVDEAAYWWRD
jgi:hypothetical protein